MSQSVKWRSLEGSSRFVTLRKINFTRTISLLKWVVLRVLTIPDFGYRRVYFPGIKYRMPDRKTVNAVNTASTHRSTPAVQDRHVPGRL